jgi:hypothetical protein
MGVRSAPGNPEEAAAAGAGPAALAGAAAEGASSDPRAGPGDVERRRRLRSAVRDIRDSNLSASRRETHFRGKYGDLFEECPVLMSAALRPNFDVRMLDVMLGILDREGEGQATEEKVGQILVDRFVKPALASNGGSGSRGSRGS